MTHKYYFSRIWRFKKSVVNKGFSEIEATKDRRFSFLEIVCGLIPHLGFKSLTLRQRTRNPLRNQGVLSYVDIWSVMKYVALGAVSVFWTNPSTMSIEPFEFRGLL